MYKILIFNLMDMCAATRYPSNVGQAGGSRTSHTTQDCRWSRTTYTTVRMLREEKNRLWHFNRRNVLEWINLEASDTARLIELPEEALPRQAATLKQLKNQQYREWDVVVDEGPGSSLWVCNSGSGLYRYISRDEVFLPTPVRSCAGLYVFDNHVVAADSKKGLVVLNKKAEILDTITQIPFHELYDIRETERFGLVVNSRRYDPSDGALKRITRIGDVELPYGFNDYLEKDSFIVYSPGRNRNVVNLIVNGRHHYQEAFKASHAGRLIEGQAFWAFSGDEVAWWDLQDFSRKSVRLVLPMVSPRFCRNDTSLFWIASASALFSFDKYTGLVYHYPVAGSKRLHQFFSDADHLYFLFEGRFSVYSKQYLYERRTAFDMQWYARQKKWYEASVDSLGLRETQDYYRYREKARWLERHFSAFLAIHPFRLHDYLAPNIWAYASFRTTFFDALASEKADSGLLEKNFFPFLKALANKGKFAEVLLLDSIYQTTHKALLEKFGPVYACGIQELRSLQQERDSLYAIAETPEKYHFYEALLFRKACCTGWLGEVACDQSLALSRLEEFTSKYPGSSLSDDAAFYIADINARNPESGVVESPGEYKDFLASYPGSGKRADAMMALLEYYSDRAREEEGLELAERMKAEFPEVAKSRAYKQYMETLKGH